MYKKLLSSLVFVSSLQWACAQTKIPTSPNNNTLLWEIKGKGLKKPSYLFGTYHLICADSLHLSANLKAAFTSSQSLYLEMDMDNPENTFGAMKYMTMKNDSTLSMFMSSDDYQNLSAFLKDTFHINISMIAHMKPSFSSAMFFPAMMSCKKLTGVETELMKLAKADKKEIKGLETIEFQSSVFDKISYQEQARELLKLKDSLQQSKIAFAKMMQSYLAQDLTAIEKLFEKEPGFEETKDDLIYNRNKNWVTQLEQILKEENIFMAVGAGHLVGEEGLINLLRKKGYQLRPLLNKD